MRKLEPAAQANVSLGASFANIAHTLRGSRIITIAIEINAIQLRFESRGTINMHARYNVNVSIAQFRSRPNPR